MRRLFAAIAFLSRLPVPRGLSFDGADVGRATLVFPLVGALLGAIYALAAFAFAGRLPPLLGAALLVGLQALITGALHLDALADMADGFGGGRTREDILRIMREHTIGAYGAVALVLVILLKTAALSTLIATGHWPALIVAGGLSRWGAVPLARLLPYARREGGLGQALTDHVGPRELAGATLLAGLLAIGGAGWSRGLLFWGGAALATWVNGSLCKERLGGITGDTLGANTEICETFLYVLAVAYG